MIGSLNPADHRMVGINSLIINDVENKRIGVYTGTIYDKFAVQRFSSAVTVMWSSYIEYFTTPRIVDRSFVLEIFSNNEQ